MPYRKTRLVSLKVYTSLKSAPLDTREMILKWVNREAWAMKDAQTTQLAPTGLIDTLRPPVGLYNFFRTILLAFRP